MSGCRSKSMEAMTQKVRIARLITDAPALRPQTFHPQTQTAIAPACNIVFSSYLTTFERSSPPAPPYAPAKSSAFKHEVYHRADGKSKRKFDIFIFCENQPHLNMSL